MLRIELERGILTIREDCIAGILVKEKSEVGFEGYAEVVIDAISGNSYHTVAMERKDAESYADVLAELAFMKGATQ